MPLFLFNIILNVSAKMKPTVLMKPSFVNLDVIPKPIPPKLKLEIAPTLMAFNGLFSIALEHLLIISTVRNVHRHTLNIA